MVPRQKHTGEIMAKRTKTIKVTPATSTPQVTPATAPAGNTPVAVAPTIGKQGHATKGAHVLAWQALSKSDWVAGNSTATLQLVSGTNTWRPGTPGHTFYNSVLMPLCGNGQSSTVAQVLEAAVAAGFKAKGYAGPQGAPGHITWLYAIGGHLAINGLLYGQPGSVGGPAQAAA